MFSQPKEPVTVAWRKTFLNVNGKLFFVFSGYKSLHEFDNAGRPCIQLLCLMSCFQVDGRLLSLTCRKYAIAIQIKTFYDHKSIIFSKYALDSKDY